MYKFDVPIVTILIASVFFATNVVGKDFIHLIFVEFVKWWIIIIKNLIYLCMRFCDQQYSARKVSAEINNNNNNRI